MFTLFHILVFLIVVVFLFLCYLIFVKKEKPNEAVTTLDNTAKSGLSEVKIELSDLAVEADAEVKKVL